jgi:DNA-dependent RNA polymerase auxiliary subunit epsilon
MDHCMDLFEPMDTCGSDTVSDFSFLHNRIPSVDPSLHHFKQRKKKASALNDSDWEPYRERIFALHASGTSHKDIREIIREEEGFYPEFVNHYKMLVLRYAHQITRSRQYKSRFKKWGLNKNIKEAEKRAIVRKMQEMNLTEVDKRELVFWVGCQRVDSAKIQSWKQNRNSSGTSPYAPAPGACRYPEHRIITST